jgi:hypothetical protein
LKGRGNYDRWHFRTAPASSRIRGRAGWSSARCSLDVGRPASSQSGR